MKSILFVLPTNIIGGAETKFYQIIKRTEGIRSVLLTHQAVADFFLQTGARVYTFEEYGCYRPMPVSISRTIKYARAIADITRREAIQCIVGIMHTGSFYSSAARDIFRLRVPFIGTIEGPISAYFENEKRKPTFIEKSLLWYLLRRPPILVVPSGGVRKDLANNFGILNDKISVIYNGIDIKGVNAMSKESVESLSEYSGKTLVTACRLDIGKDFTTLLKAFREIKKKIESRLIIIGEGELKSNILKHARELCIEKNVIITGFQRNPYKFYRIADVFVLSSFFEGFGNVIVEAMSLGIPVVSTDCPSGPGEIIQHGINGLLVPMEDHNSMAEAVIKLMSDKNTRDEIVRNGNRRVKGFSLENMTENFSRLILRYC